MKIIITEEQSKKLFIPRKLSGEGSRWEQWNNKQPIVDGKRINQYDNEGMRQGYWEESSENGMMKGSYINGLRDGEWEEYWTNGNLRLKCNMVNNKREGVWEWYNYKGNLESKILYDDNILVKDLPITESEEPKKKLFIPRKLSDDDSRYSEMNSKQPMVDGVRINQYNSNGNKEGMWIFYYHDGKLHVKGSYINGLRDSEWEFYGVNGEIDIKGSYDNGAKQGVWEYYFDDGKLYSKGNFKDGVKDGYWEYYHDNGKLSSKGLFKNDSRHGLWKFYDVNGKPTNQIMYDTGNQVATLPLTENIRHKKRG